MKQAAFNAETIVLDHYQDEYEHVPTWKAEGAQGRPSIGEAGWSAIAPPPSRVPRWGDAGAFVRHLAVHSPAHPDWMFAFRKQHPFGPGTKASIVVGDSTLACEPQRSNALAFRSHFHTAHARFGVGLVDWGRLRRHITANAASAAAAGNPFIGFADITSATTGNPIVGVAQPTSAAGAGQDKVTIAGEAKDVVAKDVVAKRVGGGVYDDIGARSAAYFACKSTLSPVYGQLFARLVKLTGHELANGVVGGLTHQASGSWWSVAHTWGLNATRASGRDLLTAVRDTSRPSLWRTITHDAAVRHGTVSMAARLEMCSSKEQLSPSLVDYNLAATLHGAFGEVGVHTEEKMRVIKTSAFLDTSAMPLLNPKTKNYPNDYARVRCGAEHSYDALTGAHGLEAGYEQTYMTKIPTRKLDTNNCLYACSPSEPSAAAPRMPFYEATGTFGVRGSQDCLKIGYRGTYKPFEVGCNARYIWSAPAGKQTLSVGLSLAINN